MSQRYSRHYTLSEAQALLPAVQQALARLRQLRNAIESYHRQLQKRFPYGFDVGGPTLHRHVRRLFAWNDLLEDLDQKCIIIRDLDRGLVDFPSFREGREIFLCWEEGEPGIAYWHEPDAGYDGRQPL